MRESVPSRHIRTVLGLVMALCLVGGIAACEFPTEKQLAKPLGSSDGSGSSGGTTPDSAFSEADSAIAVLQSLPVKGRAPKTGYNRDQFGQRWSDNVSVESGHNGCDTRNDILRRDLTNVELKPGSRDCVVVSGLLHDPRKQCRLITWWLCPMHGKPARSNSRQKNAPTLPTTH